MYTGYYTLASGILTNQRAIDVVGNNLLQSQTPGYRSETVIQSSFEANLNLTMGVGLQEENNGLIVLLEDIQTSFHSGMVEFSDRTLDVAINGAGFFMVEGTEGETWLTRNGQFDRSVDGYLTLLSGGHRVLDQEGNPIAIPSGDVTIYTGGEVYDANSGEYLGTIGVGVPDSNESLERLYNDMFILAEGEVLNEKVPGTTLLQHYLEGSNVDFNLELTRLIDVQRSFQACSTAIQVIDGINQKAASRLGALN